MTKPFPRTAITVKNAPKKVTAGVATPNRSDAASVQAGIQSKNIIKKTVLAFYYSMHGLKYLINDLSWRIELAVMLPVTIVTLLLGVSPVEKLFLFGSCFLVLIVEALNASIEAIVDKASPEIHPLAKKSKDIASAAVFLSIIQAIIVWLVILL